MIRHMAGKFFKRQVESFFRIILLCTGDNLLFLVSPTIMITRLSEKLARVLNKLASP